MEKNKLKENKNLPHNPLHNFFFVSVSSLKTAHFSKENMSLTSKTDVGSPRRKERKEKKHMGLYQ